MGVSHDKLAAWYLQLAQSISAGLPIAQAIELSAGPPKNDLKKFAAQAEGAPSFKALIEDAPAWIPQRDRDLIANAAQYGRLSDGLYRLQKLHENTAKNLKAVIGACIYPVVVLHLAILAMPIAGNIQLGSSSGAQVNSSYFVSVLSGLIPLWTLIVGIVFLAQRHSPILFWTMRILPGLGAYSKSQAYANLATSLEAYVNAGAPLAEAWRAAGRAANYPPLSPKVSALIEIIEQGGSPGEHLAKFDFPKNFTALYLAGEQTGQLDENLANLAKLFQENANLKLQNVSFWYPKLIFFLIAIYIGLQVLRFWGSYFQQIQNIGM